MQIIETSVTPRGEGAAVRIVTAQKAETVFELGPDALLVLFAQLGGLMWRRLEDADRERHSHAVMGAS